MNRMLSIIVPTRNEEKNLKACLGPLQTLRKHKKIEIIICDGGSSDNTLQLATTLSDNVISSEPGRARQMNAAAQQAIGYHLLFLHADTRLTADTLIEALPAIEASQWGRFDVKLSNSRAIFRLIETLMNLRSRLTGVATGDQAIFVESALFHQLNGFADIALMEDIAISKQLRRIQQPCCLHATVSVSTRYWETHGTIKSILSMWFLRAAYAFGASPNWLKSLYYR